MFHDRDNFLRQIGTGYSGGVITNAVWLPSPSSYVCEIEGVSGANAKRTEDTVMHKPYFSELPQHTKCDTIFVVG